MTNSLIIIDNHEAITYANPQFKDEFRFSIAEAEENEQDSDSVQKKRKCPRFFCCGQK